MVRIYDVGDTSVVLGPDGAAHEFAGASAQLARALLSFHVEPRTRAEVFAHVESLTGGPLDDTRVVEQLLGLLEGAKVLVPAPRVSAPGPARGRARVRLVLGLSGAIATALSPALIGLLQRRGFEVRVIATPSALRFVAREALEALVHYPVLSSLWPEGGALPVPHINLAHWADAVLICPASATTISRLATGDHSDLVSAVALTTRALVMLAPSMNVDMYAEPAVARNLAQLIADGVHVVQPGTGVELAHAPHERVPALGPMPPHAVTVELLEVALRIARSRAARARGGPPRDADEWDALFRTHADAQLAWHVETLDEDIVAAIEGEARPGCRALDLGTGLGVAAIELARRGCVVVATDVSATALTRARERAEALDVPPITWVRDDICDTRLCGRFELVVDRGCLHLLAPEQRTAYAEALAQLVAPGGLVILKTHALSEGDARGTTPYDAERVRALLGHAFELCDDLDSSFPGPGEIPSARLFVLRRA